MLRPRPLECEAKGPCDDGPDPLEVSQRGHCNHIPCSPEVNQRGHYDDGLVHWNVSQRGTVMANQVQWNLSQRGHCDDGTKSTTQPNFAHLDSSQSVPFMSNTSVGLKVPALSLTGVSLRHSLVPRAQQDL